MVLPNWLNREDIDIEQGNILSFVIQHAGQTAYYYVLSVENELISVIGYNPFWAKGNRVIRAYVTFPMDTNLYTWLEGDEKQAIKAKIINELKDQSNLLLESIVDNSILLKTLGANKLV